MSWALQIITSPAKSTSSITSLKLAKSPMKSRGTRYYPTPIRMRSTTIWRSWPRRLKQRKWRPSHRRLASCRQSSFVHQRKSGAKSKTKLPRMTCSTTLLFLLITETSSCSLSERAMQVQHLEHPPSLVPTGNPAKTTTNPHTICTGIIARTRTTVALTEAVP